MDLRIEGPARRVAELGRNRVFCDSILPIKRCVCLCGGKPLKFRESFDSGVVMGGQQPVVADSDGHHRN